MATDGDTAFPCYESYEASGEPWLGDVPQHWNVKPLWTMFRRVKRTGYPDEELLSVYRAYGVIPTASRDDNFNRPSEDLSGYQLVKPRDLVTNKMKTWQGSIAVSEFRGIVSPAYHVYAPQHAQNDRYLHYLLRSPQYVAAYGQRSKGIRVNQWDLEPYAFSHMTVLLPPATEQLAIADFLDRETAKIDALIDKKQRLLELLEEKRTALITQAVTKGLEPDVETKDSGVVWLGNLPAQWKTAQLRYLVRSDTVITYGIVQAGPDVPDGIPYIRTGDMSGEALPRAGYKTTSLEIDRAYRRSKVEPGDIVVAIRASVGKALKVPGFLTGANLTQGTARIAPGSDLDSDYLLYALNSVPIQQRFEELAKGATFREITLDMLRRLVIPLPPLQEQRRIATRLTRRTSALRQLTDRCRRAVALLQEYRIALISAAVTGKIDVREAVA